MIVTDLKYPMDSMLVRKMNHAAVRCSGKLKHQNVFICDGTEGYGKTTLTAEAAYYLGYTLRRPVKLFFDIDKLMSYAVRCKDEILIWDDAAFAGLSVQAYNKSILKLIKVIWLGRKKRNTYFINIQEIFRLKELLVSRAVGLLHVYSPDEIKLGQFAYFNKKSKDVLFETWQRKKKKGYKIYYSFKGTFPDAFGKIFDEEDYDSLKDHAIMSIDVEEETNIQKKMRRICQAYATYDDNIEKLAKHAQVTPKTIYEWKRGVITGDDAYLLTLNSSQKVISCGYIEPLSKMYLSLPAAPIIIYNNMNLASPSSS